MWNTDQHLKGTTGDALINIKLHITNWNYFYITIYYARSNSECLKSGEGHSADFSLSGC